MVSDRCHGYSCKVSVIWVQCYESTSVFRLTEELGDNEFSDLVYSISWLNCGRVLSTKPPVLLIPVQNLQQQKS